MKLFVLTLNWEGKDKLEKLYPTVINSLKHINYEWIIKDNGSKDDSVKYLQSFNNTNIKVIEYKNNLQNFSAGMNYCFNETKANDEDLILLLNNDIIINDNISIENMINLLNSNNTIGAVGARLLYTNTDRLQHAGVVFNNKGLPMHFRLNEQSDNASEQNREFQTITGAVMLTKAKYYKNICTSNKSGINGLDENFHWAFDDIDACLSIKYNLNKKIIYCGKTNIFHEESASLKKNPANKLFMNHNVALLKNKWSKKYSSDHDIYIRDKKYKLYGE